MDEYISKQKVLNYINGYLHSLSKDGADTLFVREQRRALTNLIQDILVVKAADVQPVAEHNKWINAKEQKPEAYEDVLVLFEYYFCGGNTTKLKIGTAYYVKDGDKWLGNDLYVLPNTNVIYWQPKTAESGGCD